MPKSIKNKVSYVLHKYPETRKDDMKLYIAVVNMCVYENKGVGIYPFEEIINNHNEYGIPCYETVRRARQKITAVHPELGCSPAERRRLNGNKFANKNKSPSKDV